MGNQANFCCDHNAQFKLFESSKRTITKMSQLPMKNIEKQLPMVRNQRIFSRDDISIIDQLDFKSSNIKEDPVQTMRTAATMTDRENIIRPKSSNLQFQQKSSIMKQYQKLKRERQWFEHKIRELQQQKQKQTSILKNQIQCEQRTKQSLKNKKSKIEPRTSLPQKMKLKHYDFQFIVNYR